MRIRPAEKQPWAAPREDEATAKGWLGSRAGRQPSAAQGQAARAAREKPAQRPWQPANTTGSFRARTTTPAHISSLKFENSLASRHRWAPKPIRQARAARASRARGPATTWQERDSHHSWPSRPGYFTGHHPPSPAPGHGNFLQASQRGPEVVATGLRILRNDTATDSTAMETHEDNRVPDHRL